MSNAGGKNQEADEFLSTLGTEETLVERKGRHYVEGEARFATVAALTELTKTVTALATSQTAAAIAQTSSNSTLAALAKNFEKASAEVDLLRGWMEGTVSEQGERSPGFIDHIATFKRWKNWVLALLSAIALGQGANTVIGLLNHAAVTAPK